MAGSRRLGAGLPDCPTPALCGLTTCGGGVGVCAPLSSMEFRIEARNCTESQRSVDEWNALE